jgi:hypothetical protein
VCVSLRMCVCVWLMCECPCVCATCVTHTLAVAQSAHAREPAAWLALAHRACERGAAGLGGGGGGADGDGGGTPAAASPAKRRRTSKSGSAAGGGEGTLEAAVGAGEAGGLRLMRQCLVRRAYPPPLLA